MLVRGCTHEVWQSAKTYINEMLNYATKMKQQ
jgi:hypothetical protein